MLNSNEQTTYDMYASVALQALITKLPLHDRDGEYGPSVDGNDLRGLKNEITRSAHEYAVLMMQNRKEFIDSLG